MSTVISPKHIHNDTSSKPTLCPFRIRVTSYLRQNPFSSWCAHHEDSCNLHQPCTVTASIAKDPDFRIQTALLWIRSNESLRRRTTSRLFSSENDRNSSEIILNDAIQGVSSADPKVDVREDKPDLGLLHLHRDRLAAAAEALGWTTLDCLRHDDSALSILKQAVEKYMADLGPLPAATLESRKVRILIARTGEITVDSTIIGLNQPVSRTSILTKQFVPDSFDEQPEADTPTCKILLDTQPTRPSTLTTHKTLHRCMYNAARERVQLQPTDPPTAKEVLLYNPYNEIMETSACTIYFNRDGIWITPAAICGPSLGVTRRLAIEKGLCKQGTVEKGEVRGGENVWLSNAVRGFFRGVIVDENEDGSERSDVRLGCEQMKCGR